MKYALNNNQKNDYLAKADEIYFNAYNLDALYNLIDTFPDKTFIQKIEDTATLDDAFWINMKAISTRIDLHIGLPLLSADLIEKCQSNSIKYFYNYPVLSWYELNALTNAGSSYAIIAAPLIFYKQRLEAYRNKIKFRISPNIAHYNYLTSFNNLHGGWIRPEDIHLYDPFIEVVEFANCADLHREQALFRIYKEEQEWLGKVSAIIPDFPYKDMYNTALPREFGLNRLNCRQRCEESSSCHYCEHATDFGFIFPPIGKEVLKQLNKQDQDKT